jgi:arsenate reductase (thioredoxin)
MNTVIFACVHNAGRSQIAAAFFNKFSDPSEAKAISAGTQPVDQVHLRVRMVMSEVDIDLSGAKPTKLTPELATGASYLITMGCKENCPYIPNATMIDWPFEDPNGKELDQIRVIRDMIKAKVLNFLAEKLWLP